MIPNTATLGTAPGHRDADQGEIELPKPATVAVYRLKRITFAVLPYQVKVDGAVVGQVGVGSSIEFPLYPGSYTLQVVQWLYRSKPLRVEVAEGARYELVTKPRMLWFGFAPFSFLSLQFKVPAR